MPTALLILGEVDIGIINANLLATQRIAIDGSPNCTHPSLSMATGTIVER